MDDDEREAHISRTQEPPESPPDLDSIHDYVATRIRSVIPLSVPNKEHFSTATALLFLISEEEKTPMAEQADSTFPGLTVRSTFVFMLLNKSHVWEL